MAIYNTYFSVLGLQDSLGVLPNLGVLPGLGRLDDLGEYAFSPASLFLNGEQGVWYDPSDLTPEKVSWRRNLLTYSEQFENTAWGKTNTTVTANQTTAPDGTSTADLLASNTTSGAHLINRSVGTVSIVSGLPYTFSVFMKKGTGATAPDWMQLTFATADFGSTQYANFNLNTGAVGTTGAGATASIVNVGNGWYRCIYTATATATNAASIGPVVLFTNNNDALGRLPSYVDATTSDVFVWGAQFEQASSPSSYQRITDFNSDFLAVFPTHTLFQDSAGTQPVTVLGQSVGRILDKSGRGNHSTQATAASRPTLQARVNLFLYSEQFDNAAWTKTNVTITANSAIAPDGTMTADTMTDDATNGVHRVLPVVSVTPSTPWVCSVYAKAGTGSWLQLRTTAGAGVYYNISNGTVGTQDAGYTGSIQSVGNGWYRCIMTSSASVGVGLISMASADNTAIYAGTGSTIFIWGAQAESASTIGTYQRVVTATDYADIGAPRFLQFDGTDDSLATIANVDFTATDKMSVFLGVTKLSDATIGIVAELSATLNSNNGCFNVTAPNNAAATSFGYSSKGTTAITVSNGSAIYASPTTRVLTGLSDIGGDVTTLRLDGVQAATSAADQGTGTYLSYPIYIGRRNNATLPFNGRIFQLIVRGAATDSVTVGNAERWVGQLTGVAL